MKKFNFLEVRAGICFHGGILLRGLARTLYGALIAGLFGIAACGFWSTGKEAGYVAVVDFALACCTLMVALCNVYLLGIVRKKGKK